MHTRITCDVGTGWGGNGVWVVGIFLGWLPSVTDFKVIPWYVPIVSILNPSVSENKITSYENAMSDCHQHYTLIQAWFQIDCQKCFNYCIFIMEDLLKDNNYINSGCPRKVVN